MRRTLTATATLSLILALAACSSTARTAAPSETVNTTPTPTVNVTPRETPEPSEPAEPERTTVDWSKYPAKYQQIIDEDTAAGNCEGLQTTFDAAPSDAKLLTYIDEALKLADCY